MMIQNPDLTLGSISCTRQGGSCTLQTTRDFFQIGTVTKSSPNHSLRFVYTPPRATDKDGKVKPLNMKALNDIYKYFKHTFSGSQQESWAGHLDKLESEVFERNSFVPKQCYFTLRMTLRSAALTSIVSIEQGTEKPNWRLCIPAWYKPDAEDLTKMLHYMPFQAYSYSLRLTLIIVYFHQKFQKDSAKTA